MVFAAGHTKTKQIYDAIEKQILEGKLKAGGRIQSVREIAGQFSTSISVAQSALRKLEKKNFVEKIPGSGNFVKSLRFTSMSKNVFLSLLEEGHIYAELAQNIKRELIERGFVPIAVDYTQMTSMVSDSSFQKNVDEILSSGLKGIILMGGGYWKNPFLEKYPGLRSVFVCHVDYAGELPDRAVLLDYEKSIYLTTSHLASRGCRRIMFCTFRPESRSLSPETFTRHHSTQLVAGYDRALKEYNIASYRNIFYRTETEINTDTLRKILSSGNKPDGIVCDQDHQAMLFVNSALKLGLKVPEDLAVTGNYDTPWTDLSPVKLTSTCYDWKKLATESVRMAIEDNPPKKIVYLKPKLIIRESSVGEKNQKMERKMKCA